MKCPKCEVVELSMTGRAQVEIELCAACRVWLDRGEEEKIIERGAIPMNTDERVTERPSPTSGFERERARCDDDDDDHNGGHGRRKKRANFLGDLFEFSETKLWS